MAKPTLKELLERAQSAIDRNELLVYDVAANNGQIVGNVARMRWFKLEVCDELIARTDCWSHLQKELNEYRKS
jgi:hypothetical protein